MESGFPEGRAGSQKRFCYEHEFGARFDRTEIGFENSGYSYTLFDYYDGEQKSASREAGVRVRAPERARKRSRCGAGVASRHATAICPGSSPASKG